MSTSTSDMMLPIILVGLMSLIFGGLIGAVIASASRSGGAKSAKPPVKSLTPALQVWRDRRNGRLAVGIDDELFPAINRMSARQRASLQQAVVELQDWLGTKPVSQHEPTPVTVTAELKPPVSAAPASLASSVSADVANTPLINLSTKMLSRAAPSQLARKKPEPPQSIVTQIDEILQEALPHTILKDRYIRLVEKPGQGMYVMVDGKAYEGVGDVPDPTVRLLIQKCVNRWEKKI